MAVQWRKSSHSGGISDQQCVELGRLAQGVGIGVRDSKDPGGGHLILSFAQFAGLIEQVRRRPAG
ncbi:DUF397 domain-containing protein [Actinomadura sp. NAK00032]|uniref:DUF397 domain-containing protein n=1 Tax=Actinomadura sp. NAK00032 TaxID=2742128 RepID=UPI0015915955|nr:DUF397 domain-containing protein [Actinomadura sp. NAK00032]QKW38322.1 DUF397 domain-containing protein [Actinomadura sp. NAK00032]